MSKIATTDAVPAAKTGPVGAYGIDEFAALFGISRALVHKLWRKGKLKLSKLNSRTVIRFEEAKRFEESLPELHPKDPGVERARVAGRKSVAKMREKGGRGPRGSRRRADAQAGA